MLETSLIVFACLLCLIFGWLLHGSEQTAQREADKRTAPVSGTNARNITVSIDRDALLRSTEAHAGIEFIWPAPKPVPVPHRLPHGVTGTVRRNGRPSFTADCGHLVRVHADYAVLDDGQISAIACLEPDCIDYVADLCKKDAA